MSKTQGVQEHIPREYTRKLNVRIKNRSIDIIHLSFHQRSANHVLRHVCSLCARFFILSYFSTYIFYSVCSFLARASSTSPISVLIILVGIARIRYTTFCRFSFFSLFFYSYTWYDWSLERKRARERVGENERERKSLFHSSFYV